MKLFGLQLQDAGLTFMSVRVVHKKDGVSIDSIVCATPGEAAAINSWAADRGYAVIVRVATPEEAKEHRKWQEPG